MGFAMAGNIRKKIPATSTLFIYDVHRPSCERFVSQFEGIGPVVITESVKNLATASEVVISIVPTADNVRQVYLDQQNGLAAAPTDAQRLILECSTIESASTREIGGALRASGHGHYVDAPVSVSAAWEGNDWVITDCIGWRSCRRSRDSLIHDWERATIGDRII